jgi:transposase
LSTKIHTLVDALGNAVGFFLTGGQAHDLVGADHLLPTMKADTLLADKAYDADERVIDVLHVAGKTAVIPPKANRKIDRDYDRDTYKARHLIENFFADLKQYRAIATRYDKTARNFLAAVYLAAAVNWLK